MGLPIKQNVNPIRSQFNTRVIGHELIGQYPETMPKPDPVLLKRIPEFKEWYDSLTKWYFDFRTVLLRDQEAMTTIASSTNVQATSVQTASPGFGPLTYRTNTVLVNGENDLTSAYAIWPLAIYAARYTFTEESYLSGIWLSTSMENPTPSRIAVWVTRSSGTPIPGSEYIDLTNARDVWLHHISDNELTTAKSSGTSWAVAEMPLFNSGETITLWITNANDLDVVIDAALTVIRIIPTDMLRAYINGV